MALATTLLPNWANSDSQQQIEKAPENRGFFFPFTGLGLERDIMGQGEKFFAKHSVFRNSMPLVSIFANTNLNTQVYKMGRLLAIVVGAVIAYVGSGYLEGLLGDKGQDDDNRPERKEG